MCFFLIRPWRYLNPQLQNLRVSKWALRRFICIQTNLSGFFLQLNRVPLIFSTSQPNYWRWRYLLKKSKNTEITLIHFLRLFLSPASCCSATRRRRRWRTSTPSTSRRRFRQDVRSDIESNFEESWAQVRILAKVPAKESEEKGPIQGTKVE